MNENTQRAKHALAALRAADQQGMGRVAGGMGATATDRLADLDSCTLAYRCWTPFLIPGHLQTPAYTAGAIKGRTPSLDAFEIGLRVQHRRERSERFLARRATLERCSAWFLIGEQAITRPLMNHHAHAEQLRHLLAIGQDYENIMIQVLREDAPTPGIVEPFELFSLDPGPRVGHIESLIGGWYTVASEDIGRLSTAFNEMAGFAMGARDSREFIEGVLDTCWGHIAEQPSSSPLTATQATASTSPVPPPAPSA